MPTRTRAVRLCTPGVRAPKIDPSIHRTGARMGTIVAGRYDTFEEAENASAHLRSIGLPGEAVSVFFNSPPGRHDRVEVNANQDADPESTRADEGAIVGAAAGAALGLAALAAGPLAAGAAIGIGAYVGSLAGAVNGTQQKADESNPMRRPSGVMVAAHVGDTPLEPAAIAALRQTGALHIETADGRWIDGDWSDFDPLASPRLVDEPAPLRADRR